MSIQSYATWSLVCGMLCVLGNSPAYSQDTKPHATPVLLQMIRDDSVHQELKLSDSQIASVRDAHKSVDAEWFRARVLPALQQTAKISDLTGSLRSQLHKILNPKQMTRLKQLERQALGTRMLVNPANARLLGISLEKHNQLLAKFVETDNRVAEIQKQQQSSKINATDAQEQISQLQNDERQLFAKELSPEQQSKIPGLVGERFDFSRVKRMYPIAPELTPDGVQWVQGGPLKLESLQGKVVAVHFYAFQCINCKRNLSHYKAWYDDYRDKGLVVIGIQTPETPAERMINRVRDAADFNQMKYPVMLDAESSNWKAWSNTMWPTVYLIDKKGFLRRWWQGEMNWEGTMGEEQMRKTIEQLLAEKD